LTIISSILHRFKRAKYCWKLKETLNKMAVLNNDILSDNKDMSYQKAKLKIFFYCFYT